MKPFLFGVLVLLFSHTVTAQSFTVSGRVTDGANGEEMIGATIRVKGLPKGGVTNSYGFYSITLEKGTYTLIYQYFGYTEVSKTIELTENKTVNIELEKDAQDIEKAVVTAASKERLVENKKISVVKMEMKSIKEIPVLFGEVDVLKTITLLPGIQSAGEGNSGINVRGGGQDQNLILLDEATVYNASHLLGFFSVFNGDAIKDVEVYKGGIPAQYGGRLASLIDIRMKDGNKKQFAGTGGIGTISSRLTLEGPIIKDKSSFMIAGRRSYADLFLPLANSEIARNSGLYFYDLNLKANYEISDKDRLYLSGYFGRDVLDFADLFGLEWGNATATLRWNHLFSEKLFSNISLVYSNFDYGVEVKFAENAQFGLDQGIDDIYLKADFSYFSSPKSTLRFGGQSTYHEFNPGEFSALNEATEEFTNGFGLKLDQRKALENALYIDHEYKVNERFNIRYGLRFSNFGNIGGSREFTYVKDEFFKPIDSLTTETTYGSKEIFNWYNNLEPRFSASYNLNKTLALKASYNRTAQYIQQATNTASSFPTDQWFSSGPNVAPQLADQVAVGVFKNFDIGLETSVEIYYKWMQNQIDYREGAEIAFNENLDGEILNGEGWAYGAEFFVKKSEGKSTGFISYTWSRTWRQIDGVNNFNPYPTGFDRPHNLSIVYTYRFTDRLVATGSFIYTSGNPFTPPAGKYWFNGQWNNYFGDRNNYRVPDYHRFDVGVTLDGKDKPDKRLKSSWNFSIYNVYARENAFAIYFRNQENDLSDGTTELSGQTEAVQVALFKIIPSITWNFEF